jgi:hypothetical protein
LAEPLYRRHSTGLVATYADLENHALNLDRHRLLAGTPGSITVRTNAAGKAFLVRQFYDHAGRKRDEYIGGEPGTPGGDALMADWKARIAEASDAIRTARLLSREGYAIVTPKQLATLRPFAVHGIFAAGALLVGTHAFGAILNRLGVRASSFATEDIDIAKGPKLAIDPADRIGLVQLLEESGVDFVKVPPLDHRDPSTKFTEKGRSRFSVDLLVASRDDEYSAVYVPELAAHATSLPYFRYLINESQDAIVISSHGVLAVRTPLPERFAIHKMIVAQLRRGGGAKSLKDIRQAAVLVAALGELYPGAIADAFRKTAVSTRKHIRKSFAQMRADLEAHPQALAEVSEALAAKSPGNS